MGDRHLHSKVISDLGGLGWSFGHAYHYTQDLKKKGYIFREQSLKMGTFSCQNDP